jgi:nicotinamidase-related amidase
MWGNLALSDREKEKPMGQQPDQRRALLVIDVQVGLFEKSTPIYRADQLLDNINMLVDSARQAGCPVFFIQHQNKGFLAEGSPGWQLHPRLQPQAGDQIIHKQHGSAFQDTGLDHLLQTQGVDTVLITGLVTNGCVRATSQAALQHGYRVILVSDAHSNYHKKPAQIIDEWHEKLSQAGVELQAAGEVSL